MPGAATIPGLLISSRNRVVIRIADGRGRSAASEADCATSPPIIPAPKFFPKPLREMELFMNHPPRIAICTIFCNFPKLYLGTVSRDYQTIFIPNWISRASVTVDFSCPALSFKLPSPLKMSVWSGNTGGAKFALFRMLNISALNWTLNVSDMRRMWFFLNTAKSILISPGAVRIFRPTLPRRLKHRRSPAGRGPPKLGGAGSQFASQKAWFGAVGTAKHSVLTYWTGLPGFTRELHPELPSRLG